MSYQVLARKWRPANFKEMAGQEHVLQTLINALDNERLHHAYLFTGTRGVGKTTIARILAKCLNCEQGISSEPCGQCSACTEISEGRFIDLIEVDAASRTKVEDTRELLDNVQYAPTAGRFKIYIIDEVHMLSGHSFNALLKTLEEPPPHVKFLLATTDPQKLPITILSRCLQFNLKNLSPERIVQYLKVILDKEQIPLEESALWLLARSADGSMRDALSLTDQAIAHGNGKISEAEVSTMLGTVDLSVVQDLAKAIAQGEQSEVLALVEKMSQHAPDYMSAIAELISLWHKVAVYQAVPDGVDNSCGDLATVKQLAEQVSQEDVQLFYQICLMGRKDIPLAPDARIGFEMTLLRVLSFRPAKAAGINPPIDDGDERVKKPEAAAAATPKAAIKQPQTKPVESKPVEIKPEVEQTTVDEYQDYAAIAEADEPLTEQGSPELIDDTLPSEPVSQPEAEPNIEPEKQPEPNVEEALDTALVEPVVDNKISYDEFSKDQWISVFSHLTLGGVLQNTAANLVLVEKSDDKLSFHLDTDYSSLYEESHQQRLTQVLTAYFDKPVSVEIEVAEISQESPQAYRERKIRERRAQAIEILKKDPNVVLLEQTFNAELIESSVKPIELKSV